MVDPSEKLPNDHAHDAQSCCLPNKMPQFVEHGLQLRAIGQLQSLPDMLVKRRKRLLMECAPLLALLGERDVGLFVSTGGFTPDAEDEARRQENRRVILVDLKRLFDLWVEYYIDIPDNDGLLLVFKLTHFVV